MFKKMNMEEVKKKVTFEEVRANEEIKCYIAQADKALCAMGYTEHSFAHVMKAAETAEKILKTLGYPDRLCELAKIAGFMHDIGNAVNRSHHAEYGALLANDILKKTDLPLEDRVQIVSAIGLHDESTGGATDPISAALIIADKTDVRRSRVREKNKATFDKHDRVNYAVTDTRLKINVEKRVISLNLQIDPKICSMYEYFEIFLGRMMMCKRAAEVLEASFKLTVNGSKVL